VQADASRQGDCRNSETSVQVLRAIKTSSLTRARVTKSCCDLQDARVITTQTQSPLAITHGRRSEVAARRARVDAQSHPGLYAMPRWSPYEWWGYHYRGSAVDMREYREETFSIAVFEGRMALRGTVGNALSAGETVRSTRVMTPDAVRTKRLRAAQPIGRGSFPPTPRH